MDKKCDSMDKKCLVDSAALPAALYFRSTTMPRNKRTKRDILLETDVDAADAVTYEDVTYTTKGGKTKTKRVKVDLNPRVHHPTPPVQEPQEPEAPLANDFEMGGPEPDVVQVPEPKRRKVRTDRFSKFNR